MISAQNYMLRLAHQQTTDPRVSALINNPMCSASDRLLAEAHALELIARWITPNGEKLANRCEAYHTAGLRADLEPVVASLVRDLANPPSLETLAREAGMSHTCLNRHFRKVYGVTVFGWLRHYRLERARNYLKDGQRSITQIAFQCGFSSASHFAQCFKKYYGCSPIEFRRTQQVESER